jgi:hypothetical protein
MKSFSAKFYCLAIISSKEASTAGIITTFALIAVGMSSLCVIHLRSVILGIKTLYEGSCPDVGEIGVRMRMLVNADILRSPSWSLYVV